MITLSGKSKVQFSGLHIEAVLSSTISCASLTELAARNLGVGIFRNEANPADFRGTG